jgi:hypothetical protein
LRIIPVFAFFSFVVFVQNLLDLLSEKRYPKEIEEVRQWVMEHYPELMILTPAESFQVIS